MNEWNFFISSGGALSLRVRVRNGGGATCRPASGLPQLTYRDGKYGGGAVAAGRQRLERMMRQ